MASDKIKAVTDEYEGKQLTDAQEALVRRIRSDFQQLFFGSELGRRVFADLLDLSEYFGLSFTGNSSSFFRDGKKWLIGVIVRYGGLDTMDGLVELNRLLVVSKNKAKAEASKAITEDNE